MDKHDELALKILEGCDELTGDAILDFADRYREALRAEWEKERGEAIHYPACWDTVAYPTVDSALNEVFTWFSCGQDECKFPKESSGEIEAKALVRSTESLPSTTSLLRSALKQMLDAFHEDPLSAQGAGMDAAVEAAYAALEATR